MQNKSDVRLQIQGCVEDVFRKRRRSALARLELIIQLDAVGELWTKLFELSISDYGVTCPCAPLIIINNYYLWNEFITIEERNSAELILRHSLCFLIQCPRSNVLSCLLQSGLRTDVTQNVLSQLFSKEHQEVLEEFEESLKNDYDFDLNLIQQIRTYLPNNYICLMHVVMELLRHLSLVSNPTKDRRGGHWIEEDQSFEASELRNLSVLTMVIYNWCCHISPGLPKQSPGYMVLICICQTIAEVFRPLPFASNYGDIHTNQTNLLGQVVFQASLLQGGEFYYLLMYCVSLCFFVNIGSETIVRTIPSFFVTPYHVETLITMSLHDRLLESLDDCSLEYYGSFLKTIPRPSLEIRKQCFAYFESHVPLCVDAQQNLTKQEEKDFYNNGFYLFKPIPPAFAGIHKLSVVLMIEKARMFSTLLEKYSNVITL